MAVLDNWKMKEEMVVFIRNQNILSTTERQVTTQTDSGTFTNATSFTINRNNVRNIRSVVVASVTKYFGVDYTVDYTYVAGATQTCVITFVAQQNGTYSIQYDYGTDRIMTEYPRADLTLSSYPRVAVELLSDASQEYAIGGGTILTEVIFTVTIYDTTVKGLEQKITALKTAIIANKKSLYYVKFITPKNMSSLIKSPNMNDKIVQRSIDISAPLNVEY